MKECQYFPPYIWERVKMNKAELMPTRFGLLKRPPASHQCTVSYSAQKHEGGLFRASALTKIPLRHWQWLLREPAQEQSLSGRPVLNFISIVCYALQQSVVLEKIPVFSLG